MSTVQNKPIELYYWTTPNGWKISVLLEELGVPYNVHMINIGAGDQFKDEFLEISPNNKIPAIVDPEGPGGEPISVFESAAIMKYLAKKFDKFYPSDERAQVKVDEWLFWQMGGFGPMLGQNHHFNKYAPEKLPYAMKRYTDETHRLYGVLNKRLADHDYVAGEYSIADMAIYGWATLWEGQGMDIEEFPHVKAWLDRLGAREAVKKGMEVGKEEREKLNLATDKDAKKVLFNQRSK